MPIHPIQVMISSRCRDTIRDGRGGEIALTDLRRTIKQDLQTERLFGLATFHCWIHEEETQSADASSWTKCLEEMEAQHIVIALYNGNAGYAHHEGDIGICHAELMAAMNSAPSKVRLIDITAATQAKQTSDPGRDQRFAEYVARYDVFQAQVRDAEGIRKAVKHAVHDAVREMTAAGSRLLHGRGYAIGAPLDWSRLDYATRRDKMRSVMTEALQGVKVAQQEIHFVCDAVPAAMSVAAARELVGRPFLRDHLELANMGKKAGPVHVIGCHKNVTEAQAVNLLGFPDAVIVTPGFGVYVADNIQKIQLVLLANCRDKSTTQFAVQQFRTWLESTGEARDLAARAQSRRAIVQTIADQLAGPKTKAARS